MNKNDRAQLAQAVELLEKAKEIISSIKDKEQNSYDNLSEGLQASERGQKFEENASNLDEIESNITDGISMIEEM